MIPNAPWWWAEVQVGREPNKIFCNQSVSLNFRMNFHMSLIHQLFNFLDVITSLNVNGPQCGRPDTLDWC